ncbi:DUF2149 domain-containing protein [uncultured Methanosphaera sp.]|uniref:DUF2149 domain-containing protein n=1 Tax=uncultured Methanosphaera sp. TaxID=262501 RepID=UPI000DC242A3|nr:DUF2149 domain-containing protein [uncultured Methanosphaera sp.]RAP44043.1 MAG: hypothetical protein BZ134_04705 [Methanosphaera sp. SHI1033]
MIRKDSKTKFSEDSDTDPMAGVTNMTDIMLVLAVGFLILAMTSTGVQHVDTTSQTTQQSQQQLENAVNVTQGQQISNDTLEQKSASGSGYSKVGSVYQDPKTGKMVMVSN